MKTALIIGIASALAAVPHPLFAQASGQNCPPGLAKKNPPCVPPGQARQCVTTADWLNRHRIGDRADDAQILSAIDDLPRLVGNEVYAILDDAIIRMDPETREILELIGLVAQVLN